MGQELKRILIEALLVAVMGLGFALVANRVSPWGLTLTRDYFPGAAKGGSSRPATGQSNVSMVTNPTGASGLTDLEIVAAQLREKGLQPVDGQEAIQLFRDPQYEQELIVFVDARDDRHYREGHIPGAYQFDRIYPEKHLPTVLPACLNATKIVVYCGGGKCEDSEFAAVALKEAGVAQDRLFVYVGGMTEWATNGLGVELGERKSGLMR